MVKVMWQRIGVLLRPVKVYECGFIAVCVFLTP